MSLIRVSIGLMIIVAGHLCFAGPGAEGNGSGAMNCPVDGKDSYVFYDLWEATQANLLSKNGLKIQLKSVPYEFQVTSALHRLSQSNPDLHDLVLKARTQLDSKLKFEDDASFPRPADLDMVKYPNKCEEPIGLARWLPLREILYVDSTIYKKLRSETDKAAMWVHEYVYAALAEHYNAQTSFLARLITGYLFSDVAPENFPFAEKNWMLKVRSNSGYLAQLDFLINPFSKPENIGFNFELQYIEGATYFDSCNLPQTYLAPGSAIKDRTSVSLRTHGRWVKSAVGVRRIYNTYSWNIAYHLRHQSKDSCDFELTLMNQQGKNLLENIENNIVTLAWEFKRVGLFFLTKDDHGYDMNLTEVAETWVKEY